MGNVAVEWQTPGEETAALVALLLTCQSCDVKNESCIVILHEITTQMAGKNTQYFCCVQRVVSV